MKDDPNLLREFLEEGSETAFAELVRRHIDLVHSAALRQLRGDSDLARDATQAVFCELARKAPTLTRHRTLSGWLYNTARFVASRLQRGEARRNARELVFAMNTPGHLPPSDAWKDIEHLLDDAMHELSGPDREAIILRYFRDESLASIAQAIGSSENAARMRLERALEKLRLVLDRRGIRCPSALLGSLLIAHSVSIAPAGLAAAVTAPALAAAGAASAVHTLNLVHIMNTANLKTAAVSLALTGMTAGLILSHRHAKELQSELADLRQQSAAVLRPPLAPADDSRMLVDAAELARLRAQNSELMRLRDEVTQLRKQQRDTSALEAAPAAASVVDPEIAERQHQEARKTLGLAKMNVATAWGLAVHNFARENNGRMPLDFGEAAPHYPQVPQELSWIHGLAGAGDFEILFQGSLHDISNPSQAIILREKEPFAFEDDGSAQRTYLFADGHAEIYKSPDGNFEFWEQQRRPALMAATPSALSAP